MFFPAASQPGFWHFGNRHPRDKILCRDQANALLDMSRMSGNAHEWNAEETFRNDFRNLQGVKLLSLLLRQNTLHCPAQGSWPVATQHGGSYFTGQVEKVPICAVDVSRHRRAIKILDDSPARQEGFTFDRQVRRQRCVFTNQNGPCSVSAWHLGFPKLRDV